MSYNPVSILQAFPIKILGRLDCFFVLALIFELDLTKSSFYISLNL
jgi:hypothetical protein